MPSKLKKTLTLLVFVGVAGFTLPLAAQDWLYAGCEDEIAVVESPATCESCGEDCECESAEES